MSCDLGCRGDVEGEFRERRGRGGGERERREIGKERGRYGGRESETEQERKGKR